MQTSIITTKDIHTIINELNETLMDFSKTQSLHLISTMSIEKLELGHSNVIAKLITPNAFKDSNIFAKSFLNMLSIKYERDLSKETILYVFREYACKGKRIDIYIKTTNFNILIENKINAKDQPNQLKDYITNLESSEPNKTLLVAYLSPSGISPTRKSISAKQLDKLTKEKRFTCLSYESDIIQWIQSLSTNNANLKSELNTYIIALKDTCYMSPDQSKVIAIAANEYANLLSNYDCSVIQTMADSLNLIAITRKHLNFLQELYNELQIRIKKFHPKNKIDLYYIGHNEKLFTTYEDFEKDTLKTFCYYGVVIRIEPNIMILFEFAGAINLNSIQFGFSKGAPNSSISIELPNNLLILPDMKLSKDDNNQYWGAYTHITSNQFTAQQDKVNFYASKFLDLLQLNKLISSI